MKINKKIIKETLNEISSIVFFASDTTVTGAIMSKSILLIFENTDYSYQNIDSWDEESKKYHDELVRKFKNNDNIDLSKEEQKVSIYDLMKKETMDKNGVRGRFIIDGKFNITEDTGLDFSYEIIEKNGTNVKISITVRDEENGINKIELPGKEPLVYDSVEEVRDLEYDIELGEEYIILVTTGDGETKRVKVLIEPEIEVTEAYVNTMQNATVSLYNHFPLMLL